MRPLMFALALAVGVHVAAARADEITDQVHQAMDAYGRQEFATAITGLQTALNLLRQARAAAYKTLLPAPPADWKADPPDVIATGAAAMLVGDGASRKYHHLDQAVTVSIVADSPMIAVVSALATSGMAAVAGVQTVMIKNQPVFYMSNDNAYTAVVAGHVVVRVEGGQTVRESDLRKFLDAVDFAAIQQVTR